MKKTNKKLGFNQAISCLNTLKKKQMDWWQLVENKHFNWWSNFNLLMLLIIHKVILAAANKITNPISDNTQWGCRVYHRNSHSVAWRCAVDCVCIDVDVSSSSSSSISHKAPIQSGENGLVNKNREEVGEDTSWHWWWERPAQSLPQGRRWKQRQRDAVFSRRHSRRIRWSVF